MPIIGIPSLRDVEALSCASRDGFKRSRKEQGAHRAPLDDALVNRDDAFKPRDHHVGGVRVEGGDERRRKQSHEEVARRARDPDRRWCSQEESYTEPGGARRSLTLVVEDRLEGLFKGSPGLAPVAECCVCVYGCQR